MTLIHPVVCREFGSIDIVTLVLFRAPSFSFLSIDIVQVSNNKLSLLIPIWWRVLIYIYVYVTLKLKTKLSCATV